MATASAPGKVYLLGEHAVVYGEPALACAIERRARVTVEERDDVGLRIHANDLQLEGFTVQYEAGQPDRPDVDVDDPLVEAGLGYVEAAVEQARDAADAPEAGVEVTLESDLPIGGGLSSSAAVAVATVAAGARELGADLRAEEIAERAYQVEYEVQDGQASRMDTFCSSMGGAVRVEGEDCRTLGAPELPLVIGFDGGAGDTGTLVAGVRELKETYGFAESTIRDIGDIARQGQGLLHEGDFEELGRLMNFNHGLLSALGVSSRSLDGMAWAARDAGAAGAKLTGAGGGGCIVVLDDSDATLDALRFSTHCEEAFRAALATEGVRIEE